jgi:polyketide synthase 5
MEHAGFTRETMADSLTGVFVGLTHLDYLVLAADAHAVEGPYGFAGNSFSLASGGSLTLSGSTVPPSRWTPHVLLA